MEQIHKINKQIIMEITLKTYAITAEIGDRIALESYTLKPEYRFQTFKVVDIFRGKITVRPFNQRMRVIIEEEQRVVLLTKDEYRQLCTK